LTFFHIVVKIYVGSNILWAIPFQKGKTMTFGNVVCPHCGYRSEDDELCLACGKLFHEDDHVAVHNVSTLGFLGSGLRSQAKRFKLKRTDIDCGGDICLDPEYSSVPGNVAYNLYDDEP